MKRSDLAALDRIMADGETAVVTGTGTYEVNYKGRAMTVRERFFDVYQKRRGLWRVIASRPTTSERSKD
jgi:hypothetical protein